MYTYTARHQPNAHVHELNIRAGGLDLSTEHVLGNTLTRPERDALREFKAPRAD